MNRLAPLSIAALAILLHVTPGSGAPPNPTGSDDQGHTAGGDDALSAVAVDGLANTAFGFDALQANTSGDANTATGHSTLQSNTTGTGNTATGAGALSSNTIGGSNTATGSLALRDNTTGDHNTATGQQALLFNTTGANNTASGDLALRHNTTGSLNTASGAQALRDNTTGMFNTATGEQALRDNTTGSFNAAVGAEALLSNETGHSNTASGFWALKSNVDGIRNTALGAEALSNNTGDRNTAVGFRAGSGLETGSNNIYLVHRGNAVESATMRLGQTQTRTFIAGVASSPISGTPVVINPNGRLGTQLPSARYKADIEPLATRSENVHRLRPVTFVYREDEQRIRQYGLVAEEVAAVYPELVTSSEAGEIQGVRYNELIPLLLNELQQQQRVLLSQQRELADLRARIELLRVGAVHSERVTATPDQVVR